MFNGKENLKDYIGQALSPAKNVRVEINEDEKTAHVFVPSEELSLAIGREGQNVRLASKLAGYRIEIEGEEMETKNEEIEEVKRKSQRNNQQRKSCKEAKREKI